MKQDKDLLYFRNLKYNIILQKIKQNYYLFIPELSLIVEHKNLTEAYKILEKKKEEYFRKVLQLNAQETVKEPYLISLKKRIYLGLISFFIKTLIIIFILLSIFFISLPLVVRSINSFPNRAIALMVNMSDKLQQLPSDNKEKIRLQLKDMVAEIKPFTDELQVLWQDKN